jgi:hypothetical protein
MSGFFGGDLQRHRRALRAMATLRIAEDVRSALGPDPEAAAEERFELGLVSSGAAAALAGCVSPFQLMSVAWTATSTSPQARPR